jgi:polynucleotide 5'-hydroxyl-kinase GRC3/NOL9
VVTLLQGRVEILGNVLTPQSKLSVRKGRRIPIESMDESRLEVNLGKDATCTEVAEKAIPETWMTVAERITTERGTALILGGGDCGKTTFCTYLANKALSKNLKVAVIDGDLGQANIGPPTTLSLGLVERPIVDLFRIEPEKTYFVGITSPSTVGNIVIRCLRNLKVDAESKRVDLIIIDTDGWIQSELARNYKTTMVKEIEPDFVVAIQEKEEMKTILESIRRRGVFILQVSEMVQERGREDRLLLREQGYRKCLEGSTLRTIQLMNVKMEFLGINLEQPAPAEKEKKFEKYLECLAKHFEEVASESPQMSMTYITKAFEGKDANFSKEGIEKGLIVGLLDHERRFIGLGTIMKWDYDRGYLQVVTPVKDEISVIQFGRVKLLKGHEVGIV